MRISAIVVTFNSARTIERCIDGLLTQMLPSDEIIVVDNDSSDDTCARLSTDERVRLVRRPNRGYGAGVNSGAEHAVGDAFLILNPDAYARPGALVALRAHVTLGIVAPLQYDIRGAFLYGIRGADVFTFPVPATAWSRKFYADGAALYLTRATFDALGGFDGSGFLFGEDFDLSWRARLLGYPIVEEQLAGFVHEQGASIAGGRDAGPTERRVTSTQRRFYTERNAVRNMIRNYGTASLLCMLPAYFVLLLAEIVILLATRNARVARALAASVASNVRLLPRSLAERRSIQGRRRIADGEIRRLLYVGSGKIILLARSGMPHFSP